MLFGEKTLPVCACVRVLPAVHVALIFMHANALAEHSRLRQRSFANGLAAEERLALQSHVCGLFHLF